MTTDASQSIDTRAGHQIYSQRSLPFYDLIVHGISNRWFWNCPTARLQHWFDHHVSKNHLDVGVGTGYFLDRSTRQDAWQRIGLLDANRACLDTAAQRIARHQPEVFEVDLSEPFHDRMAPFESVSLMYVLHCLPGDPDFRRRVLQHCTDALVSGGCLFGATILGKPQPKGFLGKRLMAAYNRKGVFGNADDTIESLREILSGHLEEVVIEQVGSVAMFSGERR